MRLHIYAQQSRAQASMKRVYSSVQVREIPTEAAGDFSS